MLHDNINNEKELLSAVAAGDEKSFAALYTYYYNRLYAFLLKFSGNESAARDILQEAFLRVWLYRDRLPEIENFQAWLYKVVSTENLTLLKKELHAKKKIERLQDSMATTAHSDAIPKPTDLQEIKSLVSEAINQMPEQRRKIYTLSRDHGYKPEEIATLLQISTQTVYNTLTAALKQIRVHLESCGYKLPLCIFMTFIF